MPLPAILLKIALPQAIRKCGRGSLAPRVYEGGAPVRGRGEKNMVPNSPSFASLSSPLLKAGAKGAVHDCGRGAK